MTTVSQAVSTRASRAPETSGESERLPRARRTPPPRRAPHLIDDLEPGRRALVIGAAPDLRGALPRDEVAISFVDSVETLAVYASFSPDVVVIDAEGWSPTAWREARAAHALEAVPVIVVLGPDGADDLVDAYLALDVVERPLSERTLARRLGLAGEIGRHRRVAAVADIALSVTGHGLALADAHRPDLPLIYVNAGFERMTGYAAPEVLGRNARFLQGPHTDPAVVARVQAAVRQGLAIDVRLRNYRRDGTTFWNDLSIRPVADAAGRLRYLLAVQRDASAQVEAELLLAEGEDDDFVQMILDELPAGVLTADAEGRTTFVNRAGLEALGLEGAAHLGAPMTEVLHFPPDLLLEEERRRRHEYLVERADGRAVQLGLSITPTRGKHAKIHWFVLFRDLTPDREAEQAHRRVERLAAMGTMVAGFAHEVRNPVTAMRSVLETLDEELPSPDPRRVYATKLIKHLERVERLVKSSLTFGRPDSPRKARVSPARLVDEAIEQMRPRTGNLGSIRCEIADGLPDILVDELHLTQVLVAILNNALDAAVYPDQVTARARLDDDGQVCFVIDDFGPGIPRHVQARMFDPFFTTKASGSGLGMSIAQRLAHDNGATIEVSSTPGRGATVRVRVPPRIEEDR